MLITNSKGFLCLRKTQYGKHWKQINIHVQSEALI